MCHCNQWSISCLYCKVPVFRQPMFASIDDNRNMILICYFLNIGVRSRSNNHNPRTDCLAHNRANTRLQIRTLLICAHNECMLFVLIIHTIPLFSHPELILLPHYPLIRTYLFQSQVLGSAFLPLRLHAHPHATEAPPQQIKL